MALAADEWSRGVAVPSMARVMAWGNAPCTTWFGHGPLSARGAVSSTTTAPIVIVGTRWDPATPYEWSVALQQQLATSTLVSSYSDGHTAYSVFHPCVTDLVDAYLVEGVVPAEGATCR